IITTATAPAGSAAELLRTGRSKENLSKAIQQLLAAASRSSNSTTEAVRDKFLKLPPSVRDSLCGAIAVYDNAPNIIDARAVIEDLVSFAAPAEHVKVLVDYLEGWWFARVIEMLLSKGKSISVTALRQKIDELRESFKVGGLPLTEG